MRYYDFCRHWTKRIEPHLNDEELNKVLVRDFNRYTWGRWRKKFTFGQFPAQFESCDWYWNHRGRHPRFWSYVKHGACHWLVNFALRLAMLAEPRRPWRILTSDEHSTVWDGKETLFDLNFSALAVSPDEGYALASTNGRELPIGKYLKEVYLAPHYTHE